MATDPDTIIICPKCGAKNKSGRKHCWRCWWILDAKTSPDT